MNKKNNLILWNDLRVFVGANPRATSEHSHPLVQLVLALEKSFLSKNTEGNWIEKKGLLIAPNHYHECDAKNIPIISIDPESLFGEWVLNQYLKDQVIIDYPTDGNESFNLNAFLGHVRNENWDAVRTIIESAFDYQADYQSVQKDERITRILAYISQNINQPINTEALMNVAHLSESRLLHLFKEKMGLPIRNYILWYRLKIAFKKIIKGKQLTEVAYSAGFSDQSHFTRTCINMIGVPPSVIVKNSKFVQVSIPE